MGLHIKRYNYNYNILHELRKYALQAENNKLPLSCDSQYTYLGRPYTYLGKPCKKCLYCSLTKINYKKNGWEEWEEKERELTIYPSFICHSDSYGGYLSYKAYESLPISRKDLCDWRSLDELKKEVIRLENNTKFLNLCYAIRWAWNDFYVDVTESRDILIFA